MTVELWSNRQIPFYLGITKKIQNLNLFHGCFHVIGSNRRFNLAYIIDFRPHRCSLSDDNIQFETIKPNL